MKACDCMKGYIHSVETCGTVDGPGIRFVVFMQGCQLRCQYCHNPDTWKMADGQEVEIKELMNQIKRVVPFMKHSNGGVTISGGEATMQKDFVIALLKRCQQEGIHTAIDTSGFVALEDAKQILDYTDLVLLDIKHIDDQKHRQLTGVSNERTLQLAKYLHQTNKPFWVRYVLVPSVTDQVADLLALRQFLDTVPSVKKVEVLPYHKMGEYKWQELGLSYPLQGVETPTEEEITKAEELLLIPKNDSK